MSPGSFPNPAAPLRIAGEVLPVEQHDEWDPSETSMAGLKAMNTAAVEPAEGALAAAHHVRVIEVG